MCVDQRNAGLGLPAFCIQRQDGKVGALYVPVKGHEGRAALDVVPMRVVGADGQVSYQVLEFRNDGSRVFVLGSFKSPRHLTLVPAPGVSSKVLVEFQRHLLTKKGENIFLLEAEVRK